MMSAHSLYSLRLLEIWCPELRFLYGGPGRSPTCDLRVRSALLYATELPGHGKDCDNMLARSSSSPEGLVYREASRK